MKYFSVRVTAKGFSLAELLTILAIISIVSMILIVSISSHKEKKDVESAGIFVAAKIREAQVAALTGQQYTPGTTPCAYRVAWSGGGITNSYIAKDGSDNCTALTTITSASLPAGAVFTDSGAIDFVLPYASIAADQVLTLQKGAYTEVVCVGTDGFIQNQDTASSC